MLDEQDEDLELFDEYLDLTEPSGNVFFEFFILNSGALLCDLAREALSIFSGNDLQKFNVS